MDLPPIEVPGFHNVSLSLFINTPVLLLILLVFFIFYIIVSSVLIYHWSAYGMKNHGILVGKTLFILVSIFLFCVSFLAISYF